MDIKVLEAQQWLNQTYGGIPAYGANLSENGIPGTAVSEAFVLGLQIDLQVPSPTGYFGEKTAELFQNRVGELSLGTNSQYVKLLQHALYCKGYDPGNTSGIYGLTTESAIKRLQSDAGVSSDGITTHYIMKAALNTDPYNGTSTTAQIQRALNGKYYHYTGIQPCDGVYGRGTNEALIYGIQAEEGLSVSTANGYWGPTTRGECPSLPYGGGEYSSNIGNFVKILQYALYFNGFYSSANFNGQYDTATKNAVSQARSFFALPSGTNTNLDVWMALTISHGNQNRSGTGFDCATPLTTAKLTRTKNLGFTTVGRYLIGTYGSDKPYKNKYMTVGESRLILEKNMKFFPIYQTGGVKPENFTESKGRDAAQKAYNAANDALLPSNTIIYFAVDYDMMDVDITNNIIPYFRGINSYSPLTDKYRVGIYGARNTCTRVKNAGLSISSFVSNMSYGYSGNIGFTMPSDWAYDQFVEYDVLANDGRFAIDELMVSSRAQPVTTLESRNPSQYYTAFPNSQKSDDWQYFINASNTTIPVYNDACVTPTTANEIGKIKPNQAYLCIDETLHRAGTWSYVKVAVKKTNSVQFDFGYIQRKHHPGDGSGPLVYTNQSFFGNYGSNGTSLTSPKTVASKYGAAGMKVLTVTKPIICYDVKGRYTGTLRDGDEVALDPQEFYCNAGNTYPRLMLVNKIRKFNTDIFIPAFGVDDSNYYDHSTQLIGTGVKPYIFIDMIDNLGTLGERSLV